MTDEPVEITITFKVPPQLMLEMQQATLRASLDQVAQAQTGFANVWLSMWAQAVQANPNPFLKAFLPPALTGTRQK